MESVDVEKMAKTRSGSIQSKEVVLGGKLTGISSFMGKDPAKLYRAFIEAADSLATGVLEGMQDREAEKSQQRQLMDAFNNLPLQLQEQEILSGFNPQTGLYDQERALQPVQTSGLGRLATETLYKGRSLIQDPEGGEVQKILGEQIVQAGIEMLIAAQMMENAGNMLGGGEGEPSYNNVAQIIAAIWQDGAGLPSELQDEMQNQRSIGGDGSTGGTGALGGPGSYVVVRGDTLGEIAKENDLTLKELMKLNPDIIDQDVIEVGEAINLPGTPQPAGSTLDGYYPGQSVPTRPGRPGTLPGGNTISGASCPCKNSGDCEYSCRNSIPRTVRPRCCTAAGNSPLWRSISRTIWAPLPHNRREQSLLAFHTPDSPARQPGDVLRPQAHRLDSMRTPPRV